MLFEWIVIDSVACAFASSDFAHLFPQKSLSLKGHSNLKLISIPLVFIFLRMWSTLAACIYWYSRSSNSDVNVPLALQYLSVSQL